MTEAVQHRGQKGLSALTEVFVVCGIYILLARAGVAADWLQTQSWAPFSSQVQNKIAGGFFNGAVAQLILVGLLLISPVGAPARRALASLFLSAPLRGWTIAFSVAIVDIAILYAGWIGDFSHLVDGTAFGLTMSVIPAIDGFSQELIFRGYLILRLMDGGLPRPALAAVSGFMFSLIHINYGGSYNLAPILGTFGLGVAWAFAFLESDRKLAPVVASHMLVIAAVQPWLALHYATAA